MTSRCFGIRIRDQKKCPIFECAAWHILELRLVLDKESDPRSTPPFTRILPPHTGFQPGPTFSNQTNSPLSLLSFCRSILLLGFRAL
ncbi:hypothetical protein COLO4_14506 [Corchorus olitorius]|uniref:Uncharacterized protein n=1 Tax=Corchorus olitorius TaxID=93759 RepID=A0A1R3JS02_9ROSI|nr:hypothetical protein COLO4_14506 [Corchorus olitorius]